MTVILLAFLTLSGGQNGKMAEQEADLNHNGIPEDYMLQHHQITVWEGGKTIWQSPQAWQVDQIVIGDVTNNGCEEMVFLLWKEGSYGPSRPFWQNGEDTVWSNHLFLYSLVGDQFKQVWCSSALSPPLQDLLIAPDPQTGENCLTARESKFGLPDFIRLKWDDWGFTYIN